MGTVLTSCHQRQLKAVPVLYQSSSRNQIESARAHHLASNSGACLRLTPADFADDVEIEDDIETLLGVLELHAGDIDLVIDLDDLTTDTETSLLVMRSIKAVLPRRTEWRKVILSASSFPRDLSEVDASSIVELPRREWELWTRIQQRPTRALRDDLIYSDYAIAHPEPREMDPRIMRMSASIRYTTPDSWLIVKGRNVRQWGYEQFYDLCKRLVEHDAYSGEDFSWGDRQISLCAERKTGTGNATTWRKMATNHHITLVANELAKPVAP